MYNIKNMEISIKIDNVTNCLINRSDGKEYDTEYKLSDIITVDYANKLKNNGWSFDWSKPQNNGYHVYQLFLKGDNKLQGMIALKHISDQLYTHVDIVESAPHNIGEQGQYVGVGAHLFAIVCKESWDNGNEGYVQFTVKNGLVEHYKKVIHAKSIDWHTMYIDSYGALYLINKYFKEE